MFPDGICRVTDNYYTKTVQFNDINYQLAQQEDKTAIFEEWCSFLNFFDSSIRFELSFMNMATDAESFEKSVRIPPAGDAFDSVRAEYSQMLKSQLARGNNGLTKAKYLTFGIEAASMRQAKPRLDHVETDLLNNFKRIGVTAAVLNGKERLRLMHSMFHMGDRDPFAFEWKWLVESGLSVKDFIAPAAFAFNGRRTFQVGGMYGALSFLSITASDISDRMLADILDIDSSQIVTMHIQSIDQNKAIKTVKHTITELDRSKIEEQKKAVRAGYDIDIIPSDLATYGRDAKALLKELQSQNERMFMVTFLVMNTGRTEQELETNVFQSQSIAQKHNCVLRRLDFQQEQGLMSSLPLGLNGIEIQRGMTTSSTAIFVPFMTQELCMDGEAVYYGLNALSHNVIMADRKKLKNPNGLYLGVPGSGKSFAGKRELVNVFLATSDRIIILDPMGEYSPLVSQFGEDGLVVEIAPNSPHHINPMDLDVSVDDEVSPISLKCDFILSLMELIVGGKDGLQPVERTIIDRCARMVYRDFLNAPGHTPLPTLQDFYGLLCKQTEAEAKRLATALEIYVSGSLNIFNHKTNVGYQDARVVCFDLKRLGAGLRTIAMHIINDLMNSQVSHNFARGIATWCYYDEFHVLLQDELTSSYFVAIWKMLRKKGCVPSALTQNVKDLLASRQIENIFENSDFMVLLSQAQGDRQILAKQLGISPHQLSYVTHSNSGEGLLFFGNVTIPFVDRFPKNTKLYSIMTTRPEDRKMETAEE